MKLAIATIASLFASAAAVEISSVPADSKLGMNLLSKARRAEQNAEDGEADVTWISGYALKFQGCHHISQWNAEAEGDEDVRIETKRLARFRLCPVESCSSSSGAGCSGKYGDYIVDMDTFLQTYVQTKQEELEEKCESKKYYCGCEGSDDEQACLQTCFTNAGADYYDCIEEEEEQNAYGYNNLNANGEVKLNYMDYMECAQYQGANGNNNGGDGAEYFVGPYCSDQGGKIVLGLFTDDTCTEFADEYGGRVTFQTIAGGNLPYSSTSIVDTSCYSCEDGDAEANGNNAYGYQAKEPKESCTMMYENAGKCESKLTNELGYNNINENACTYMEGIKITRSNGIIIAGAATGNKVASAFIGIFTTSFVLLGAYVYYLKQKLERGSVNLSD